MRDMRTLALLGLMLVAAACQPASEPAATAESSTPAGVVIGGVDLSKPARVLGTEPFWGVEIRPDVVVFTGVDRADVRAPNPGARLEGMSAVIAASDATGRALTITLKPAQCSDGMSDWVYPLAAEVKLGDETLTGCADAQTTLDDRTPP
jgi:uncharacterized membrane protein